MLREALLILRRNIVVRNTFIIVLINGVSLLLYRMINPNKEIERFYKDTSIQKYYMLQLATSILLVSFVFNARYLLSFFFKIGSKKILAKLKTKF